MRRASLLALMICVLLTCSHAYSQTDDPPKYEVAAEFSTLNRDNFTGSGAEAGLGARFTFNFNKNVSFESAGYFFPRSCFSCERNGQVTEVLAGLKVGKRFEHWGIFAKARPGVISFSRGKFEVLPTGGGGAFPFTVEVNRLTTFAADLGGVVEFYPSKRIVTRFDVGNTIIHFGPQTQNAFAFDPVTGNTTLVPFTLPAKTTHNFQFMTSVGFRF